MSEEAYRDATSILDNPPPWNHVMIISGEGVVLSPDQRGWCRSMAVCRLCAAHEAELARYIREEEDMGLGIVLGSARERVPRR